MLLQMTTANRIEVQGTPALHDALSRAIDSFQPGAVIETGTFRGMGTTRVILKALGDRRPPFYTIEVSQQMNAVARGNLADVPFVHCLWGCSVDLREAIHHISRCPEFPAEVVVDHTHNARDHYLFELGGGIGGVPNSLTPPDNLLWKLLQQYKLSRPLICLDSAGPLGWLEFQGVVAAMADQPFLLFLDDVNHIKHHRSRLVIESVPGWKVWGRDMTDGWMVAERCQAAA